MKLINKLDETLGTSMYSGKSNQSNEVYLRAIPKKDENGIPLKSNQRYYVFRMLFFENGDRKYPFIARNEHEFYKKDASGKVIGVKRICCPTTLWAKNKIQEAVGNDYCPICKYSLEQKSAGWKNYRSTHEIDKTCLDIARETEKKWAVYLPVLVVSDPAYPKNNNHLKILRLSGEEGRAAYTKIGELINEANKNGFTVFNGGEGANLAMLCEKESRVAMNKNNEPIIDPKTGNQKTYLVNAITDIRLLTKNLRSYPKYITEAAISDLRFDETYAAAATKDQLSIFLTENYLDNGVSDSDFGEDSDFENDDFSTPTESNAKNSEESISHTVQDDVDDSDDEQIDVDTSDDVADVEASEDDADEFTSEDLETEDENPSETIARLTKGKVSSVSKQVKMEQKCELPPDTDAIRNESTEFSQDDFPF